MIEIGSLVDEKYRILRKLGSGGMSVVYLAINEKVNKTWAIKDVRKDGKMDFEMVRQGLMAEVDTLKKLRHPNLPSIVDVIEDDDSFVIVMDYIEGVSLDKIIKENGAQPEAFVVEWAKQLCDVFGYLHSQTPPIIYRDMKPANIMLKPDKKNIMVIDFGTVKTYEGNTGETTGIGTKGYAAPEQYIRSGRTDARTDIYCLGITLYHLLTNDNPCDNLVSQKSIRAINPSLSRGLDAIIQKCTQYRPEDRYQSCAELMYDLENYERLEPLYKKRQMRKLRVFFLVAGFSFLFAAAGVGTNIAASQLAVDTYAEKIYEASKTTDPNQRADIYEQCIKIPEQSGKKEAYLGLIQTFKEDSVFTVSESNRLKDLITENKRALQQNMEDYTEICFEIGKLYWYYYGDDTVSTVDLERKSNSVGWFKDVLENAPEEYENRGMAEAYYNIGRFVMEYDANVTEGTDSDYRLLFDNLTKLLDTIASDKNEKEIVRLRLMETAENDIEMYAEKFKAEGVTEEELVGLFQKVKEGVDSVNATGDTLVKIKNAIEADLPKTEKSIYQAYNSGKGDEK